MVVIAMNLLLVKVLGTRHFAFKKRFEITSTNGVPAFAGANLSHPTNSNAVLWLFLSRSIGCSDHQRSGSTEFRVDVDTELQRR
jgi:hypothetical protein